MLVLEDSDMIQLNNAAQYNAWKGQLFIHEQLVCDIALQAPSACSIPAQLSDKLELKEVIRLSDLKKKLPEDIFRKTGVTGQEVSFENIYYSLYSVIASNIVGTELDQLLKYLKDQDLALIKVLNDHGFLILVSSAVLQSKTGICDRNTAQLNAAFLFPHQKFFNKERKEWKDTFVRKELPSTIANLLPGLQYAIIESNKLQKDRALYPGPLVEQYFRKYAVFQTKKGSSLERKPEQSEPGHGDDRPKKCSQLAFSCLQLYVSSPVNFSVPLIKMSNILAENASLSSTSDQCVKTVGNVIRKDISSSASKMTAESKAVSGRLQGKCDVHKEKEQHSKKSTKRKYRKRIGRRSKRKSNRTALTTAETGENRASNKRRRLLSEEKKQIDSSNKVTVKLANVPYPQRRKRGAEVLTAAFIQDDEIQTGKKLASSKTNEESKNLTQTPQVVKRKLRKIVPPDEPFLVPDKPAKLKASGPGKKSVSVGVMNNSESLKKTTESAGKTGRAVKRSPEKMKNLTVEQVNTLSPSSKTLSDVKKPPPPPQTSEDSMIEKRVSMYESHALNLLADLALNTFGSKTFPYLESENMASANESLVEEASDIGDAVSTVENPPKDCSLPAQSTTEPEHTLERERRKSGLSVSPRKTASQKRMENSEKHMSPKAHIAAAKAKARCNARSKISLEHSYSQLPINVIPGKSAREINEQYIQVVPDSTTPADVVLKSSTIVLPVLLTSENVSPETSKKQRAVSTCQDNFAITFNWEPKYDFDFDSKFTSDPLEKTINRALHGPWNNHLKERVEDVKIILHMWIALFYSKSNKPINYSSRKVVEHSNPAKYVSINTVLDPFEFYEYMDSDDHSVENTNNVLPTGKKSEPPCQGNPLKSGNSPSKSLQELTASSSIPTKDYNIKLASEIFQMFKNSESTLYRDSLQTSMTCKGAQTPANVMKTIFGTNVPTVCYIGDTNLPNTELTDKSENCMGIGGFSSEKAESKEIEHTYSRDFSDINDAQKPAGSRTDCTIVSPSIEEEENVEVAGTVSSAESTSQTHSDLLDLHNVTMPPTSGDSHQTASNLEFADKWKYFCVESKTIHSPEIPTAGDLNKDIIDGNLASVALSSENDENAKHLATEDELSVQSRSLVEGRMPAAEQTAESQGLLQASILLSQELKDNSAINDEPDESCNIALQNPEGSDHHMAITISCSASDHNDVNTELYMDESCNVMDPLNGEALKCDQDSSRINHVGSDNLPNAENLDTNVLSESIQSEDFTQVGGDKDNVTSNLGPEQMKMEGLAFINSPELSENIESNMTEDSNQNCTEEGKTDSAWDGVGFVDGQQKALEDIPDETGNLVEPKDTHDEVVSNEGSNMLTVSSNYGPENEYSVTEITSTDIMNKLELSNSSDEVSDVESTAKSCSTDHRTSVDKLVKESSEKTEGEDDLGIRVQEINTSVAHCIPALHRDNFVYGEDHNVQQADVLESGHVLEASTVGEAEMEMPEKPCLRDDDDDDDDDADLLNVADTEEGSKESEPSNCDGTLNSAEGSLPEASKREVPSIQEEPATLNAVPLAEDSHYETCLVSEPPSAGADSCGVDGTFVLGDLDIDGSSEGCTMEVSILCEKHEKYVHKEELAESQNHLLLSQTPFLGKMIKSNTSSVETEKEEVQLSGSEVKEMQIDALLAKAETETRQTFVNNSVSLGLSKGTLEGKSDVNSSNEKTVQSNIISSFRDPLMSQCSEMDSEQPVEKQQPVLAGDAVYLCSSATPTKIKSKDSAHSSRTSSSNKKEILSKLKRICQGSIPGNVSSSSENMLSLDENSITGGFTRKEIEVIDLAKTAPPHEEDESTLENCDVVAEEYVIDNLPDESVITTLDSVEPETLEGVIPPEDHCLMSPSLEDVSDGIEQDPSPELPDICFIVNTGSISKEQYDRWSETSDEDIEYICSSKEALSHQEHFQKEIHLSSRLFLHKKKCSQEQTTIDRTKKWFSRQSGSSSDVYKRNEYFSRHLQNPHYSNISNHGNVVTKNIRDPARAMQTIDKESSRSDLDHLFSNRMVSDNLTQNTLDMENVRFICKLKEILRKSSTDKPTCAPPFQTMFESRRIPSCSNSTTKGRNPLLITMQCPYRRTNFRRHGSRYPSTYNSSPYYEEELWDRPVTYSRTSRKVRTPRYSPVHFSRLRYENTLDKSNSDISVILNECVQSNRLKLNSVGMACTSEDRMSVSQLADEGGWQPTRTSVPVSSKSQSVKKMISDLCTNLHSRLHNVTRVPEQQISFYIYESDDADFISSAKSLLLQDGHVPTDPQDFLNSEHSESHELLVIIKNEDVFSSINKIPYLMQIKLLPNVTFAGVDSPEDITESTYEELFQAGGFVASEKSVLENLTPGKLKDVLAILEKMNRTSPWKWLIHYRENRKLKDDKRAEARTKMSLLTSCQQSKVIEILPYHQCDNRSKESSEDLSCLLNLQYQHIHSRLAVYLTGASSAVTEEYEQNGILMYDVDTFIRKIQKVDSQLQTSYWS